MQEELIDRFGKLPEPVKAMKPTACGSPPNRWASSRSTPTRSHHLLQFEPKPPIDAMRIIELVQRTSISAEWSGQTAHHRQHARPRQPRESNQTNDESIALI
jgi:transcription-repair coupling factor (superfamily II helicase)